MMDTFYTNTFDTVAINHWWPIEHSKYVRMTEELYLKFNLILVNFIINNHI